MRPARPFQRLFSAIAAAVLAGVAAADTPDLPTGVSESDFVGELPVVLSVSRLSQALADAPGAVTIIDREMIRLSGARELADLFRMVAGFSVARAPQAPSVVAYHGLTETFPRRMQVLVDGRSQYQAAEFSGVNWNMVQVALDDIERIEVVRGSNSAAYGSNAFLGVANIITRRGSQVPTVTVTGNEGQGDVSDRMLRVAYADERFDFRLTLTEDYDNGIDRVRDDRSRHGLDTRLDFRIDADNEIGVRYGTQAATVQIGAPGSLTNPERKDSRTQDYLQLDWHRTLGPDADLAVRYARSHEGLRDRVLIVTAGTPIAAEYGNVVVPVDYVTESTRDEIELQHTLRPSASTRLVWGGGWREDEVTSPHFFGSTKRQASGLLRLFGNLEWRPLDHLVINAGATHEQDSNIGEMTAPRVVASLRLAEGNTLRFGMSRAYRTPSLLELRADQTFVATNGAVVERILRGNTDLEPESMDSHEIGYLGEFRGIGLSLDVRAFVERVHNRVGDLPSLSKAPYCEQSATGLFLRAFGYCGIGDAAANQQYARISGIEYQADYRPFHGTRMLLGQSFVKIDGGNQVGPETFPGIPASVQAVMTRQQTDLLDRRLVQLKESSPTHSTTFTLMQKLPLNIDLSLIYTSVGAMRWTSNTRASAYQRLDWRVGVPFAVGPTRGEMALTVQGDGSDRAEYASAFPLTTRGYFSLRLEY